MPEGREQPRDASGKFVSKANGQLRENPETGELEMKIKVNGEEQFRPLNEAQELTQKGAHYTTVMQEARKLQKQYQKELQDLRSGGSGVNQDFRNQHSSAPGSGVEDVNGPEHPGGPSLNPADIPDPIDEPEKHRAYIAKMQSKLTRLSDLEQEIQGIKGQQQQISNQVGRENDHKYLQATIPGYDKQAVEDELTRIEADPNESVKEYDHRYGMELLFRRTQGQSGGGEEEPGGSKKPPEGKSPQRQTPYQESTRNAPPASQNGSAPQGPAETSREAEERYMQYNKTNARSGG